MTNWDMKMYEELLEATEKENGTMYAMSEGTVSELMDRMHTSNPDVLGVKYVRFMTKEDFSCGDEYLLMEIVDAEKLRNITLNMDWSEAITHEEFEDALKSLEESKRILLYRAARGLDEEYMDRGLLSFIRSSIVNTQVDEGEIDSRVMSDEEKVIEKLVVGDKLFQPTPSQQTFSRPSRSVETSFEGIFWAFALLAFAGAIMFLINNTK